MSLRDENVNLCAGGTPKNLIHVHHQFFKIIFFFAVLEHCIEV